MWFVAFSHVADSSNVLSEFPIVAETLLEYEGIDFSHIWFGVGQILVFYVYPDDLSDEHFAMQQLDCSHKPAFDVDGAFAYHRRILELPEEDIEYLGFVNFLA